MIEQAKDMTPEKLESFREMYLTVGKLKQLLNQYELEDDALVMIERIEDSYFTERGGWTTYKQPNSMFKDLKDEFHPAWYASPHNGEKELFIKIHY